ncbi:MAG: hypothetical protein HQM09_11465 [Candidatus Riflebacteria bacterium]|nr:hypothetical protein [Candidatus Riflebacteria bacterium]
MLNGAKESDPRYPPTTPFSELPQNECEALKADWIRLLGETVPGFGFREKVFGIFIRTREWMTAFAEKRAPCSYEETLAVLSSGIPAGDNLKGRLLGAIFLASLEGPRQSPKPGAISVITSILRLALGWGEFLSPSLGREVPVADVRAAKLAVDDASIYACFEGFLRNRLADSEWFVHNGLIRGTGALVVACWLVSWYARGATVIDKMGSVGIEQTRHGQAIVEGFFKESPAPFEKVMHEGLFAMFFDALLTHELVVASLARLI